MGRVVVAPSHSDVRHRVLAGLMAFAWLEIARRGFNFACGAFASPASIRMYRQMGFKIEILAPSRLHWGEMRYPILFDVPGSAEGLARRWASGQDAKQAPSIENDRRPAADDRRQTTDDRRPMSNDRRPTTDVRQQFSGGPSSVVCRLSSVGEGGH